VECENERNYFAKIAQYSKSGLCAVAGNDDDPIIKTIINGDKVYDVHSKSFTLNDYTIIGNEGSTGKLGGLLYTEKQIRKHLKNQMKHSNQQQCVIVSHSPPYGILDFAVRHGRRHIGSVALREFIDQNTSKIPLVICGHVHRQGERAKKYKDTYVVNCASHSKS
jgi:Icc-related predicted phosphoesterase